jgi:hypothetical protein
VRVKNIIESEYVIALLEPYFVTVLQYRALRQKCTAWIFSNISRVNRWHGGQGRETGVEPENEKPGRSRAGKSHGGRFLRY